ncbi:uncharacterized protein DNG_03948 [Cephalotrichum gorgonifer]|uniref:HET domain-containing protein n=1 Tax=Cephalotrichum gorgonifer TaxID=2041049 RepID=A0AAE8SU40_9PEZI|nr:uncharacterized protein DNG_03948 [Cephalotrichum gorgonifer]
MWLINCRTYGLEYFHSPLPSSYLILSHTWGSGEVTFKDMADLEGAKQMIGFEKIRGTCEIGRSRGFGYAWVDTCCIDKSSSAELTESINSMFRWYEDAGLCIAYLEDLPIGTLQATEDELRPCRWFTRGWTLQELVAPHQVEFCDKDWNIRGNKSELNDVLHNITVIDKAVLSNTPGALDRASVAKKMSWAADRETTRIEDVAYSLMGIFKVNMPLIYGEREDAFLRLQDMIAQKTNDLSLFAWQADSPQLADDQSGTEDSDDQSGTEHSDDWYGTENSDDSLQLEYTGIMASSPRQFRQCATIECIYDQLTAVQSLTVTNTTIELTTSLGQYDTRRQPLISLKCTDQRSGFEESGGHRIIAIPLLKTASGFVRLAPHQLWFVDQCSLSFGPLQPISIAKTLTDCKDLLVRSIGKPGGDYTQFYVGYGEQCTVNDDGKASTFIPESCYPGALAEWYQDPNINIPDRIAPAAYSPGLVCPVGYETACSLTRWDGSSTPTAGADTDLYDILKDGETAVGCCPSNYKCKSESYYMCESTVTAGSAVTAVSYDSKCEPSTLSTSINLFWAALMDSKIAEAPRVILVLPNPTATSDSSSVDDAGDDGAESEDGSSKGLSTGGKIAIGVVIPVVAILAAAVFWFIMRRKRLNGQKSQSGEDSPFEKAELPGGDAAAISGSGGVAIDTPEFGNAQSGVVNSSGDATTIGELGDTPARNMASEIDTTFPQMTAGAHNKPIELPGAPRAELPDTQVTETAVASSDATQPSGSKTTGA